MWDKKIKISKHVLDRYEERQVSRLKENKNNVQRQIFTDLKPLNIKYKINIGGNTYKVVTRQNKVYIIKSLDNYYLVKTIYKKNKGYGKKLHNKYIKN